MTIIDSTSSSNLQRTNLQSSDISGIKTNESNLTNFQLEQMGAPDNVSTVLWRLSSPEERRELLAENTTVSVGQQRGYQVESVNVPLYDNDTSLTFNLRIAEAVADKAKLSGNSRAEFIKSYVDSPLTYGDKSGEAAFAALKQNTLKGRFPAATVTVNVGELVAKAKEQDAARAPGLKAADAVRNELGSGSITLGRDDAERALNLLNNLSDADKRAAINDLAADGTLNILANAITQDGIVAGLVSGGMTTDQQSVAMSSLIKGLGGSELAKLSTAFANTSGVSFGGYNAVVRFSDAIAKTADIDVKRDFILSNIGQMNDKPNFYQNGAFSSTRQIGGDIDAIAASRVLASMDGTSPQTRQTFEALATRPDQLGALLDAATGKVTSIASAGRAPSQTGKQTSFDPSTYQAIMRNAAALPTTSGSDNQAIDDIRVTIFNQANRILSDSNYSGDKIKIATGMVPLVGSSPNAIVQNAVTDGVTKPNSLRPLVEQLIKSGDYESIGLLKDKLISENYSGDPTKKNSIYRAGVFTGTVVSALDNVKADGQSRAKVAEALTKNIARIAGGTIAGSAGDWSGLIYKEITDASFKKTDGAARDQLKGVITPVRPDATAEEMKALENYRLGIGVGRDSPNPK
jgi:hypothetical protein